jgi:phage-related protein
MPNLHAPNIEGLIQLATFDFSAFGGSISRYCDTTTYAGGTPETSPITYRGLEYTPLPFQTGGFASGGENMVRPSFQLGDYSGALYEMLREMNFAPGAPVTLMLILKADILANNVNGIIQTYKFVLNRVSKKGYVLDLELATHLDFAQRKFPGIVMTTEDYPALNSTLNF